MRHLLPFRHYIAPTLLALTTALSVPAVAETFGTWRYECSETGPCQIFFGVRPEGSEEMLLTWSVLNDPASGTLTALLQLPKRVALPPGLRLEIGNTSTEVPYQYCDDTGCTAILVLDAEIEAALAAADTATVVFVRYGAQRPESYEIPVSNFGDAAARLRQN